MKTTIVCLLLAIVTANYFPGYLPRYGKRPHGIIQPAVPEAAAPITVTVNTCAPQMVVQTQTRTETLPAIVNTETVVATETLQVPVTITITETQPAPSAEVLTETATLVNTETLVSTEMVVVTESMIQTMIMTIVSTETTTESNQVAGQERALPTAQPQQCQAPIVVIVNTEAKALQNNANVNVPVQVNKFTSKLPCKYYQFRGGKLHPYASSYMQGLEDAVQDSMGGAILPFFTDLPRVTPTIAVTN